MPFWINIIVVVLSFAIAALTGIVLVPFMRKIAFGQTILKYVDWHKSKQGTPIMGGFMFIIASLFASAVGFLLFRSFGGEAGAVPSMKVYRLLAGMIMALLFSAVGFADDYIKAVKKQNLGLKARQKIFFQVFISAAYLLAMRMTGDKSTTVNLIFADIDIGLFYYPFMILVIIFVVNAVNLTDGVDGLCGTLNVISSLSFASICMLLSQTEYSVFAYALAGGCIGFLVWNLHPAKIFMGDTGSMFLGGAVVALGLCTGQEMLLVIVALVYILEALSVVLQVISFKTTGKRIFKMSPIHHHFEKCGWSEYKIVAVFSIVGLAAGAGAVSAAYFFVR